MLILIENLPETVSEDDVMLLIREYDIEAGIRIIDNKSAPGCCSCLISFTETSQVLVNNIAARLDGFYWRGVQLSVHRLLFG